jgi:hypothetical protein
VLDIQRQKYKSAQQALDNIRPGLQERIVYAIKEDLKTRHHLSEKPVY